MTRTEYVAVSSLVNGSGLAPPSPYGRGLNEYDSLGPSDHRVFGVDHVLPCVLTLHGLGHMRPGLRDHEGALIGELSDW